jgi:hypothetical protein
MITFETYFERIVTLHLQFDTARKALEGFGKNQQTLERYAAERRCERVGSSACIGS